MIMQPSRRPSSITKLLLLLPCLALACNNESTPQSPYAGEPNPQSPYAGQQTREIKALSASQIDDLLAGAGMGYAKVAELNGFPGPKHVLELDDELRLTENQRYETGLIFTRMQKRAKELGSELLSVETELDQLFSHSVVDSAEARDAMLRIAQLRAELRWTHVRAHLTLSAILTEEQRQVYAEQRGYGSPIRDDVEQSGDSSHERSHDGDHQM
jgi:Spy/CpxP family protein refolding chaperone